MSKYFITQLKRLLRVFPAILLVAVLLYGGLTLALNGMILQWNQSDVFQKVNIGMVGTADDYYLDLGLKAVQTMDSSKFTVSLVALEEQEAKKALETGEIDAYIYFPPEFVDYARTGFVKPLKFVSAAGSENILSLVKEELTTAIDSVLLSSERAAFGLYDALADLGEQEIAHGKRNELALALAALMLNRQDMYMLQELGVANGQSFGDYLLCGILTLFLFLLTMPFVGLFVRENSAMEQHLKSRGIGFSRQVLCEITAYFLTLLILAVMMLAVLSALTVKNVLTMIPAILSVAAISYFIYGIAKDLITGVLMQFVAVIAMCFVSGCMYPVHFFPVSIQNFGAYLPPSLVRSCVSSVLYGTECTAAIWGLLGVAVGFTALSVLVRYARANGGRRAKV